MSFILKLRQPQIYEQEKVTLYTVLWQDVYHIIIFKIAKSPLLCPFSLVLQQKKQLSYNDMELMDHT